MKLLFYHESNSMFIGSGVSPGSCFDFNRRQPFDNRNVACQESYSKSIGRKRDRKPALAHALSVIF